MQFLLVYALNICSVSPLPDVINFISRYVVPIVSVLTVIVSLFTTVLASKNLIKKEDSFVIELRNSDGKQIFLDPKQEDDAEEIIGALLNYSRELRNTGLIDNSTSNHDRR